MEVIFVLWGIYIYIVRYRFSLILFPCKYLVFPEPFAEGTVLSLLHGLDTLTVYICFISILSYFISVMLFYRYIYIIGILICISFDGNEINHILCFLTIFAMNCIIAFLVSFHDFFLDFVYSVDCGNCLLSVIYDEDISLIYAFLF